MEALLKKMVELDFLNREQAVDIVLEYQEKVIPLGSFLKNKNMLNSDSIFAIIEKQKETHLSFKQVAIELGFWKEIFEIEYSKFLIESGLSLSKILINRKIISAEELVKIFDEEVEGFNNNNFKEVNTDEIVKTTEVSEEILHDSKENLELSTDIVEDSKDHISTDRLEELNLSDGSDLDAQNLSEVIPTVDSEMNLEHEIAMKLDELPKFKDQYNEHFQEDLLFKIENLNTWANLDAISKKVLLEIILESFNQIRKISQASKMFSLEEFAFLIASSFNIFVEHNEKINDNMAAQIQKKLTSSAQMLWDLRLTAVESVTPESAPELNENYLFFIQDFSTFCDDFMKE